MICPNRDARIHGQPNESGRIEEVSATKIAAPPTHQRPRVRATNEHPSKWGSSTASTAAGEVVDREQMLDRLQHLRTILPVFAQELATARRHAAQLRRDNRRLLAEVHRLQRLHSERRTAH
jgi:hypothetical protein